jgi:hypothetical protein
MFYHAYNRSGGRPLILEITAKDTETLTEGDMLNLETGEIDLAATNDTDFVGVLVSAVNPDSYVAGTPGSISAVDSVTKVKSIVNDDAVYSVVDANARLIGATLDIAGATGAQTVAASSNADFRCMSTKGAAEPSLVAFVAAETWLF